MTRAHSRVWPFVVLGAMPTLAMMESCRDPTEVTVDVTTNDCGGGTSGTSGIKSTALYVAKTPISADDLVQAASPNAETDHCVAGDIGSLVVTPGTDHGAIVVIAGFNGKKPTECVAGNYLNCVIARRTFSFVSHTPLKIPVLLDAVSCLNVPCDAESTCVNGACRASGVDCNSGGCTDPGNNMVVDAGTKLFPDGAPMPPGDSGNPTDGSMSMVDGSSDTDGSMSGVDGSNGTDGSSTTTDSGTDANSQACGATQACCDGTGKLICGKAGCAAGEHCCDNGGTLTCSAASCITAAYCCSAGDCLVNTGMDAGGPAKGFILPPPSNGTPGCTTPITSAAASTCQ